MGTNGKVNRGIPDRTPVTPLFTYLREIDQMTRCSMETGTTCNIEIKKYMISSMTAVCLYLERLIDSPTRGGRFLFDQYMINTCTINSIM